MESIDFYIIFEADTINYYKPIFVKKLLFISLIVSSALLSKAQDFPFGEIDRTAITMTSYDKDTSAAAVVVREFGTTSFLHDGNKIRHRYHVRIKVFNSARFTRGDVVIPLYQGSSTRYESVDKIRGIVYYPGPDGGIQKTELNKKSIIREKSSEHLELVKFAMPNIVDGSVIEYKYEIESPYIFNYHPWQFQWDIPKVYSEYIAFIPAVFVYNVSLVGALKLDKSDGKVKKECFQPGAHRIDCSELTYAMNDIPAFIEEDYMTSPKNFISAINFELSEMTLLNGSKEKITKEWKDVDYEMKKHEHFGKQLRRDDIFKKILPTILNGNESDLEKAKAIYSYIQSRIRWNNRYGHFTDEGLKKAVENRVGNVADINLALIAALGAADLDADAVVLSTRENGVVHQLYPVISDFNYVVAMVNIDGESYLLDATDPLLPFGLLPMRCMNGQGRIMSMNKPSEWIDLAASQKRSDVYSLELELQADGKIVGSVKNYKMGYAAFYQRHEIKKFNSIDEFVEDKDENMPNIRILDYSIINLDSIERTLEETYEVEIAAFDSLSYDQLFFNPFFMDKMDENPFKLVERTYPVDLGAPINTRIIISLRIPEEYEMAVKPQDVSLALPNKGGRFLNRTEVIGNKVQFSQSMELEKSIYHPEEYPALKELFNRIIQLQKTDVIFKKKS